MLWIKAFHVIFVICWFAGLFYLPRLFVYHAEASDSISLARFKLMERRLYRGITTPSAILATLFGLWMIGLDWQGYMQMGWVHAKLSLVVLLWAYHLMCGYYGRQFQRDQNSHSALFFRWFNEFPVVLLIAIVILAVVKPF